MALSILYETIVLKAKVQKATVAKCNALRMALSLLLLKAIVHNAKVQKSNALLMALGTYFFSNR